MSDIGNIKHTQLGRDRKLTRIKDMIGQLPGATLWLDQNRKYAWL